MTASAPVTVSARADAAYQAVRRINHVTMMATLPAPVVYEVLGSLAALGHGLAQACPLLARALVRSLDTFDVYEDDGRDPIDSVALAEEHLTAAAGLAAQLGAHLSAAQGAIARQGHHAADTDTVMPVDRAVSS